MTKLAKPENREAFARNVEIITMHADLDLAMDLAGGGAGCLPLDVARLTAAIDGLELNSVRNLAVRVLTGSTVPAQEAPVTVSVPAGSQAPWPTEPPAEEGYEPVYVKRDPVHRNAAVPRWPARSPHRRRPRWQVRLPPGLPCGMTPCSEA